MKVVYESVSDNILDAVIAAENNNLKIHHIELNKEDFESLKFSFKQYNEGIFDGVKQIKVHGIKIFLNEAL